MAIMSFWLFFFVSIAELSAGLSLDRDSPVLVEGPRNDWETYAENGAQNASLFQARVNNCHVLYSFWGPWKNNLWQERQDSVMVGHSAWWQRIKKANSWPSTLISSGGIFSNPGFKDYHRGPHVMTYTANLSPAELTLPGDEELALGYDTMALLAEEYDPRHMWTRAPNVSPYPLKWFAANLDHPKEKDRHLFEKYRLVPFGRCGLSNDAPNLQIVVGLVLKDLMKDRVPTEIFEEFSVNDSYNQVLDDIKAEVRTLNCRDPACLLRFAVVVHDGPTIGGVDLETELGNAHSTFAKFVEMMMARRDVELIFAGHVDPQLIWEYDSISTTDDIPMRIVSNRYDPANETNGAYLYTVTEDGTTYSSTLVYQPTFFPAEYLTWCWSSPEDHVESRTFYVPMYEPYLGELNCDWANVEKAANEEVTPILTYHVNGTASGCTLCQTLADALLWAGSRFAISDNPPDIAIVGPEDMRQSVDNNTRLGLYAAIPAWEFVVTLKLNGSELTRTLSYQYPQDKDTTNDNTLQFVTTAGLMNFNNADWLKPAHQINVVLYLEDGSQILPDAEYTIIATTNTTTRSHSRFVPLWDAEAKFVTTWRPIQFMEKYLASPEYAQVNPAWVTSQLQAGRDGDSASVLMA